MRLLQVILWNPALLSIIPLHISFVCWRWTPGYQRMGAILNIVGMRVVSGVVLETGVDCGPLCRSFASCPFYLRTNSTVYHHNYSIPPCWMVGDSCTSWIQELVVRILFLVVVIFPTIHHGSWCFSSLKNRNTSSLVLVHLVNLEFVCCKWVQTR